MDPLHKEMVLKIISHILMEYQFSVIMCLVFMSLGCSNTLDVMEKKSSLCSNVFLVRFFVKLNLL